MSMSQLNYDQIRESKVQKVINSYLQTFFKEDDKIIAERNHELKLIEEIEELINMGCEFNKAYIYILTRDEYTMLKYQTKEKFAKYVKKLTTDALFERT